MKKLNKVLSIIIAIALTLTSLPFALKQLMPDISAASAVTALKLNRPSASMTVTEVTRVAYSTNTMQPPVDNHSVIVKSTPSGIPYMTGTAASSAYAGETPVATTVSFTPGVTLDSQPTIQCNNTTVKLSSAAYSNGTYTWTVSSGTALAGSTLVFTVTYDYSEVNSVTGKTYKNTYQSRAVSYVESIETPAGIFSHTRTYENYVVGSTTKNRAYITTMILGKNTYGSLYNNGTGDGSTNFSASWGSTESWTSAYGVMKNYSNHSASREFNASYGADSSRPISYVYMDKSIHSTLSDLNLRLVTVVPQVSSTSSEITTDKVDGVFVTPGVVKTFSDDESEDDPANDADVARTLGIGNPTKASIKTRGSSMMMYFTGSGPVSADTPEDYSVAIRYQTSADWTGVYVGHSLSLRIITCDKGKLRTLVEDIQNTDPVTMTTSVGTYEYKGHNPQSWYYSSGYEDFLNAYNSAKDVLANPRATQQEINSAEITLTSKYRAMKLKTADYTYAKIYYDFANTLDEDVYTLSSWAKLQTAIDSYVPDYSVLYQPTVDKIAVDIQNAIESLEYKKADYTAINSRLETVNEMYNNAIALYGKSAENTYNNWNNLISTLNNSGCVYNEIEGFVVGTYLPMTQQATVDGYVVLIDAAIRNATLKGADYTNAFKAESAYNLISLSQVLDEFKSQLTAAYNELVGLHNLDMSHQAEVDEATGNLNFWLENVEYKPADISAAISLIQTANAIDRTQYEDFSSVETAIENLESKLDLDIRYQSEINSAINALQSAIDKLTAHSADYTQVDLAIDRANDVDRQIIEQYKSTYGYDASEFYSNWSNVQNAINSVIRKLDVSNQNTVDNYAGAINLAIDSLQENVADYSAVNEIRNTANNILSNQSKTYTSDSLTNLLNATLAIQSGYLISRQAEVDAFGVAIENAMNELVYVDADYSRVNAKITQANELLNTAEQYESEHLGYYYYTAQSKSELEIAVASVVKGLDITQQSVVDGYETDIQTAINGLVNGPADYQIVDLALANVPENTSVYTTTSVATLNACIKAVKRTYTTAQQAQVDKFASNIRKAIDSLKYKTADYSEVTKAKATVPTDNSLYSQESWQLLQDALNAVVYNREIIYQDEVNLYATAINDAVSALKYKSADYSGVEIALSKIPSRIEDYTDDTVEALNAVIRSINYNCDIRNQDTVDGYAQAVEEAIRGLQYKKADYSEIQLAIANATAEIEKGWYTDESVAKLNAEIEKFVPGLDITHQSEIDELEDNIVKATNELTKKLANYTELQNILDLLDNSSSEIYNYSYSNYDEVMGEIFEYRENTVSKSMNLTIDRQSEVDAMTATIQGYINSLVKLENGEKFEKKNGSSTVISNKYIYGLKTGLTKQEFEDDYITSENVDITYGNTSGPFLGTGTTVTVKSSVTKDVIRQYTLVVFGDADGNARVNVYDLFRLYDSIRGESVEGAELKAVDLNSDGVLTADDAEIFSDVITGTVLLDHATGAVN